METAQADSKTAAPDPPLRLGLALGLGLGLEKAEKAPSANRDSDGSQVPFVNVNENRFAVNDGPRLPRPFTFTFPFTTGAVDPASVFGNPVHLLPDWEGR